MYSNPSMCSYVANMCIVNNVGSVQYLEKTSVSIAPQVSPETGESNRSTRAEIWSALLVFCHPVL